MKITKGQHFSLTLLLMGLLVSLSSCGSVLSAPGIPPGNKPDRVRIEIDLHSQEKPIMTLTVASMVQQLYATIYALPLMPNAGMLDCTLELGPHYTLTFYQGQKMLVTALAQHDGCRPVSLSGEQHERTVRDNAFWDQLDSAIYEATPAARVDWLSLMPTSSNAKPPQTAQISSTNKVQHFYDAILALPLVMKNNGHLDGTPDYQLTFHTANQTIATAVGLKQNLVVLNGEYLSRGGAYRMNNEFKQLFQEILTGTTFVPAHPDQLSLLIIQTYNPTTTSKVHDAALMQKLYARVFTLPAALPPPENCLGNDKVAGKAKWYNLTFSQWGLVILQATAYEGTCTFVAKDFNLGQSQYLQADQEFWTWIHQATSL